MPIAGNYLQQELAIITGAALDAMVVDVQCIMENVANVADCYHTKLITTNPRAKIASGNSTVHIEFDEHHAFEIGKEIVKDAVRQLPQPSSRAAHPDSQRTGGHGRRLLSTEAVKYTTWAAPSAVRTYR